MVKDKQNEPTVTDLFGDRVAALMGEDDAPRFLFLDNEVAKEEVLGLTPAVFVDLPLSSSILFTVDRVDRTIAFCSTKEALKRSWGKRRLPFGPKETTNLCWAIENDRVWRRDFNRWINNKLTWPNWKLELKEAMAGITSPDPFKNKPLANVLNFVGALLRGIEIPNN